MKIFLYKFICIQFYIYFDNLTFLVKRNLVWGEVGRVLRFDPFIWAVLTLIYNVYFILVFILYIFYREYTNVLLLLLLLLLLFCYSEFCYDASIQMSNSDGLSEKKSFVHRALVITNPEGATIFCLI